VEKKDFAFFRSLPGSWDRTVKKGVFQTPLFTSGPPHFDHFEVQNEDQDDHFDIVMMSKVMIQKWITEISKVRSGQDLRSCSKHVPGFGCNPYQIDDYFFSPGTQFFVKNVFCEMVHSILRHQKSFLTSQISKSEI